MAGINDSAVYVVSANALAEGKGYRLISWADAPPASIYPVGYPWLLSRVIRWTGTGEAGVTAMRMLSAGCMLAWVALLPTFFGRYLQRGVGLLLAATIALNPIVFWLAGEIMSEGAFSLCSLLLFLTLPRLTASTGEATSRNRTPVALAVGALCGACLLLRTIGGAFLAGAVVVLVLRRQCRVLPWVLLAAAAFVVPWVAWSAQHRGGTFGSYSAQNVIGWWTPLRQA